MDADDPLLLSLQQAQTFPEILSLLHGSAYSGPITIHFLAGRPQTVEITPRTLVVRIPIERRPRRRDLTPPATPVQTLR